jgi:septal ring factor EnvC (AmiA/AmiB activator)
MSNTRDIDWHKGCLKNFKRSIQQEREEFERLQKSLQKAYKEYDFYEKQIVEAEKAHKDKFDRERYLVKKATK